MERRRIELECLMITIPGYICLNSSLSKAAIVDINSHQTPNALAGMKENAHGYQPCMVDQKYFA